MTQSVTQPSCLVMAASRRGVDDPVAKIQGLSHKCLVTLDGQVMLERVLEALVDSGCFAKIHVSVDRADILTATPAMKGWVDEGRVVFVQSHGNLADSVLKAVAEIDSPLPMIITTGDNALHTPEIVRDFVRDALASRADAVVGFTREDVVLQDYANSGLAFHRLKKPSIAKIRGLALAGGCGLAMLPTFSIASDKARFGLPEINVGMWPMMVTATLFRTVGRKKGMELICLGEIIDAHEAEKMGMITRLVEDRELDSFIEKLAGRLRNKSSAIFRLGLEAYQTAMDMEYEKAISFLRDSAAILTNSPDSMEGTRAFVEKRKPNWTT